MRRKAIRKVTRRKKFRSVDDKHGNTMMEEFHKEDNMRRDITRKEFRNTDDQCNLWRTVGGSQARTEVEKDQYKSATSIQVPNMKGGEGDKSYAKNSSWQRNVILKTMPLIQESNDGLFCNQSILDCLKFADMGCSLGPTGYLPTWQVIEALDSMSHRLNNCKPPMLQVFLNDLPGNDFNTLFKSLPSFYERLKKEKGDEFGQRTFIAARSQAPKGLISDTRVSLNKENIFITETSHPSVHKAYLDQFESNFTTFLRSRRSELEAGGRMVLVFVVDDTIFHPCYFAPLGTAIKDMVSEGLIEESKLEPFNMPVYKPRDEEIWLVIKREGSFDIHQLQITFKEDWVLSLESEDKALDLEKYGKGKQVALRVISAIEPLLVTHFGHAVMDDMFQRYSVKLIEYLETKEGFIKTLVICLIKK
ncbi:hypothetical protein LWI28_015554 [Acer negundo]|uniref:Uncharacterized protein n=1 Tax=Acer negundo TaxID=4023 RepID=A0AAD5J198_ACENE|nr:hypothetical protein LWI28_015554 [Acer negundo]